MNRKVLLAAIIFLWVVFLATFLTLPETFLIDIANALSMAVGLGILAAYGPGAIRTVGTKDPELQRANLVLLSFTIFWLGYTVRIGYLWVWRWLGSPLWMIEHPFVAGMTYFIMTGGLMLLAVYRSRVDGRMDGNLRVGLIVALGAAFALLVIVFLEPTPIATR